MKAFRRIILDEVPLRHDWHRFFIVLAYARGYTVTEIDIELHPRLAGSRSIPDGTGSSSASETFWSSGSI
jgi:hypothetical protein